MAGVGDSVSQVTCLVFFVNGRKVACQDADPEMTLLQYLRTKLGLCGTKLGCAEGGCGACTVMVSYRPRESKTIRHLAVNACLAPLCSMHGCAVTTVEGIGSTKTRMHPVQERIARSHGSQCGFCTPGIVLSMYTLLRNNPQPTQAEMESAFEGNLCRCTGYRPILEGFKTFTKEFCCGGGNGGQCCMTTKDSDGVEVSTALCDTSKFTPYDPTQEVIFPPELQMDEWTAPRPLLVFRGKRVTWYQPATLSELLELKAKHPKAKIVVGNSEIGVEVKFKNMLYPVLISPVCVGDMHFIHATDDSLTVGATVTLTDLGRALTKLVAELPEHKTRVLVAIVDMLRWFAGHQIRNVAALGGNIMTASPISDLNPLLMASRSTLCFVSKKGGQRTVDFTPSLFTGYRRLAVQEEEVLLSVTIPFTRENEFFYGFKQANRRDDDIAIVNAGMRVLLSSASDGHVRTIQDCSLVFGGMAATTVAAPATEKLLIGKEWQEDLPSLAEESLLEDLPLEPGAPGGKVEYRQALTLSFFFKFYMAVSEQLARLAGVEFPDKSAIERTERGATSSSLIFQEAPADQPAQDVVGRPMTHVAADRQATGEAVYVDDMPNIEGQLYAGFVFSHQAHALIKAVDASPALAMDGVVDYVSAVDVRGSNIPGVPLHDEEIFATEKVHCIGQIVGVVLADSQHLAREAANAVRIQYEPLKPIITIEDAIEAQSYLRPPGTVKKGDLEAAFASADHVLEGEMRVGGQEHFYLETNASLAVPGEENEMAIYSSSQSPSATQSFAALALGIPANRVVCHVKRLGGGFGGKETRCVCYSSAVAVAAQKSGRPVRFMLDRDEDMSSSGARHPFLARYKVAYMKDGTLKGLRVELYSNAGWSMDLSGAVMDRASLSFGACYLWPAVSISGHICRTNLPSNTAFRGFGGPQGMMFAESIMTDIAAKCGLSPEKTRQKNFYKEGDLTYYGCPVENFQLDRCWDELMDRCKVDQIQSEVEEFNKKNTWKKRGVACTPVMYGICFSVRFLNQAGALVHVYRDGSVLLTHGGVEMGQGLHTKMIQVCSRALSIDAANVFLSETATNLVPNTSPTAASVSADINGMAVKDACEKIVARLETFKKKNPTGTWQDWVNAAYFDRTSLSATGFYSTDGLLEFSYETSTGVPFNYFCYGAACSVVEVDTLTGDNQVLKSDIVMDVGTSLNPAIDIGQVEGAFVQGLGLFTMEESVVSPKGFLFSRGPGTYKIPGFGDIPLEFNVALLRSAPNDKAVYSSKAVGEPPLFLAASVFYAIKQAISAAREQHAGVTGIFRLDSPATVERIRMACLDRVTKQIPQPDPSGPEWFVRP